MPCHDHAAHCGHTILPCCCRFTYPLSYYFVTFMLSYCLATVILLCHSHPALPLSKGFATWSCGLPVSCYSATVMLVQRCHATLLLSDRLATVMFTCFREVSVHVSLLNIVWSFEVITRLGECIGYATQGAVPGCMFAHECAVSVHVYVCVLYACI